MLQMSEGFRFGIAKGEAVVNYCDPLAIPNLAFSGFCKLGFGGCGQLPVLAKNE